MSLFPISLGVRRKPPVAAGAPVKKGRAGSSAEAKKALERDGYTCRCCGFRSQKYQRVVPGWMIPEADEIFVTLCRFCELCFSIEQAGIGGSGIVIWLPEISQADLNHIIRAAYVARASGPPLEDLATRVIDALMARRADAKKRLGGDDPLLLATVFHELLSDEEYSARAARLDGVRLLPLDRWLVSGRSGEVNQFSRAVDYWRSPQGPYANLPPDAWMPLFEMVTGKVATEH